MAPRHWIQIAVLTSAFGLAGAAMGQDTNRTTDGSGALANEAPSAGAIVTPEDKAAGLGRHGESPDNGIAVPDRDTSTTHDHMSANPGSSRDDISANPGPSRDDISTNPGPSSDDMSVSPNPGRSDSDDGATVSHGQPGDMGPGDMRGQ